MNSFVNNSAATTGNEWRHENKYSESRDVSQIIEKSDTRIVEQILTRLLPLMMKLQADEPAEKRLPIQTRTLEEQEDMALRATTLAMSGLHKQHFERRAKETGKTPDEIRTETFAKIFKTYRKYG